MNISYGRTVDNSFESKAILLGFGESLAIFTTFLISIILSRIFTKFDYATYRQILLIYTVIVPLLTLGLPQSLYYFLPKDREKARSILSANLLLLFFLGFLFMLFIYCGVKNFLARLFGNPQLTKLLLVFSVYGILAFPVKAINACLVVFNKIRVLAVYNILSNILFFISIISFALIWKSPSAIVSGFVISAAIIFPFAVILMYYTVKRGSCQFNISNIWAQLKYSVPLGLTTFVGVLSLNLDRVLVSSMCTAGDFAVYVNGVVGIPLIGVIGSSIMYALIPEFSYRYHRQEYSAILSSLHKSTLKCAIVIFPLSIFLFMIAPEIIRILFSVRYEESIIPFRVYLLMLPARITTYNAIILASGKSFYTIYISIIGLFFSALLAVLFISIIGATGAIIALTIANYLIAGSYLILSKIILNVRIKDILPWAKLLKVLIVSLIPAAVIIFNRYLPQSDFLRLSIFFPAYLILLIMLFWLFKIVANPIQIFTKYVQSLKNSQFFVNS